MMIEAEIRNTSTQRHESVLAAWGVYLLSIAGLMLYSLLSLVA
jgi:hypothetical protein